MVYVKLFTNLSHSGFCRRGMPKCGDKTSHCLRASVLRECGTVSFSGTLRAVAMTVAVGQSANVRTLGFNRMAIAHTADHETPHGGIEECSRRPQGRGHSSESIL